MMAEPPTTGNPGPATDRSNEPVADPSPNVLDWINSAVQRQDDLRNAEGRHLREILALRAEGGANERKCGEELAEQQAAHLHEVAGLRARYDKELRSAEADRINAIRTVDVEAVQRTAEVQAAQQTTLAAQVQAAAEAMRTQVTAAATAATESQAVALQPITKAIEDLRRSQYEAQGQKTQVVETQARGGSTALWIGLGVAAAGVVIAVAGVLVAILVLVATQ